MKHEVANINPLYFYLASMYAASTQEVRYYLKSCWIEPVKEGGGVVITATDGHRLLSFYDESGTCPAAGLLVSYGEKKQLAKMCKVTATQVRNIIGKPMITDNRVRLILETDTARPGTLWAKVIIDYRSDDSLLRDVHIYPGNVAIDGKFPKWRSIVPVGNHEVGWQVGYTYNGRYISDLNEIAKTIRMGNGTFERRKEGFIQVDGRDPAMPALCSLDGWDDYIVAVIMPKRGTGEPVMVPKVFTA